MFNVSSGIRFRPLFIRYDRKTSAWMTVDFALPEEQSFDSSWTLRFRLECASGCAAWENCDGCCTISPRWQIFVCLILFPKYKQSRMSMSIYHSHIRIFCDEWYNHKWMVIVISFTDIQYFAKTRAKSFCVPHLSWNAWPCIVSLFFVSVCLNFVKCHILPKTRITIEQCVYILMHYNATRHNYNQCCREKYR